MKNDELGKRMKEYYEQIPNIKLTRRTPVAIRIDGKAFHTFAKHFDKPFDEVLIKAMQKTMQKLCQNIQGCVFGYTQSDEITLILVDYQTLTTSAWFNNEVQKMCSISASMATLYFNQALHNCVEEWKDKAFQNHQDFELLDEKVLRLTDVYYKALQTGAMFDSRCFNIPKEEVCNLIYWRQIDATRNSIEMLGRAYFTQKELHKKNTNQIQDMLHEQYNVNWNDLPIPQKRGSSCIRLEEGWVIDEQMPILKGDDREYVEKHIQI